MDGIMLNLLAAFGVCIGIAVVLTGLEYGANWLVRKWTGWRK